MDGEQNLQELFNWIDSHVISRQKKNLNRDFSDAVPLAEILKQHFPRWVDLHNYASKNSVSKKIDNWFTMNRKVLSKLEINLTQDEMIKLAKATPGAIEDLLFKIKRKVVEYEHEENDKNEMNEENMADGENICPENIMVPMEELVKLTYELDLKNEEVEILNKKIDHLHCIIEMKSQLVDELQEKVDGYIEKENSSFLDRYMK